MAKNHLTQEFVRSIDDQHDGKTVNYYDNELVGFFVEVRKAGKRTFYYRYRDQLKKIQQVHLGIFPEVNVNKARNAAFQLKEFIADGGDPKQEKQKKQCAPLFKDLIADLYLPYIQTKKRSWKHDVGLLKNHLLPRFGATRIDRISRREVLQMQIDGVAKGYCPGTINRWFILLHYIFVCAGRWEIMPKNFNPAHEVELLKYNGARERVLVESEVKDLFNELETNPNTMVCKIIKLLLLTGARKREVLDAQWENIDLTLGTLKIPMSKSGKPRYIVLSLVAVDLLKSIPRYIDVPWMFVNETTRRPPRSIFYAWNTIRRRVGIANVRLHDLRHSYASFLVNSGHSLYEVQNLLGHANASMTQRYAHLSQGRLRDAANSVGNIISSATKCKDDDKNLAANT